MPSRAERAAIARAARGLTLGLGLGLGLMVAGCAGRTTAPGAAGATSAGATSPPAAASPPAAFPDRPGAYAEAIIAAWRDRQYDRLRSLTIPEVYDQLIAIPGPPAPGWLARGCDGAMGSSYCRFHNEVGDEIVLRLTSELVGAARAADEVRFDATVYPAAALDYAREFVEAWQTDNRRRMAALATGAAPAGTAPDGEITYAARDTGATTVVSVMVGGVKRLDIQVAEATLGRPHAIVAVQ